LEPADYVGAVILPWLDLPEARTVLGVEFLPRLAAIERMGLLGENLAAATSHYYDSWQTLTAESGFKSAALVPIQNMAIVPLVTEDIKAVRDAIYAWSFATVFGNSSGLYANGATFTHYFQRLGGDDPTWYSARHRRMGGALRSGGSTDLALSVRPGWCGDYHEPHAEMLAALDLGLRGSTKSHLGEALEALFYATSDADIVPESLEYSLYAKVAERLLHREGDPRMSYEIQRKRATDLLRPLLACRLSEPPMHEPRVFDVDTCTTLDVWAAMREERNAWWHPAKRASSLRDHERQTVIRRNLIAFRAVTSLVIATIVDSVGADVVASTLRTYVPAVEEWLQTIEANDSREPEQASALGQIWLRYAMRESTREFLERSHAVLK